jgi:hypothetical protein
MQEQSAGVSKKVPFGKLWVNSLKATTAGSGRKMGLSMERIYWIEKVVAVEKQVRFFYFWKHDYLGHRGHDYPRHRGHEEKNMDFSQLLCS